MNLMFNMQSKQQIETQALVQVEWNKTFSFIKIQKFFGRFYFKIVKKF